MACPCPSFLPEVMAEEEILLPLLNEPIKDADGDKAQSLFRLLTQLCSQATIVSKVCTQVFLDGTHGYQPML